MIRRRLFHIALALLPLTSYADSFDEVRAEVMANNLTARAEAARANSQIESLLGENTLESPEISYGRLWNTVPGGIDKWALSISQSFDWPGVYAARREAARTARVASQYLVESTLLDLRMEVSLLLVDIIHNRQLIDMQTELVDSMNRLEEYYRKAANMGAETRIDYNKTVLERIAVHRELHSLEAQRESLISSLQALNGGMDAIDMSIRVGSAYPIMPAPEVSVSLIRERDPQYAAALAQVEAAKSMAKVERRSRFPGFSIGYDHEGEGDELFNGFSVGLTLPVWGRKHQIKANEFEAEAALMDAEMALSRRVAEMDGDLHQLKALRKILGEYEPVINDKSNYQLLQKALKAGQINFLTFIQEVNYFIAARRDYLDTLYEYNVILMRLSRYN